jgi:hypothetical protein
MATQLLPHHSVSQEHATCRSIARILVTPFLLTVQIVNDFDIMDLMETVLEASIATAETLFPGKTVSVRYGRAVVQDLVEVLQSGHRLIFRDMRMGTGYGQVLNEYQARIMLMTDEEFQQHLVDEGFAHWLRAQ